jgi:RecA-family ATPase
MNTDYQYDITELLDYIDPVPLSYQDWVNVGMALKDAGYPCSIWDEWSRRDGRRYHPGETFMKWTSFNGAAVPVTAGTIVQMAKDGGWRPEHSGHELDWDDVIGSHDKHVIVHSGWVESVDVKEPDDAWDPTGQLIRYLDTLFNDDENVGYVTEVWSKDDRLVPTSGSWDRTAGQLKDALRRCKGDLGAVLGDANPEAGAWIRFNPLDGKGAKNDNVTEYRYALVESDEVDIGQQNAILRELELPIAALVHSGKKSLHAIVRIDAPDYTEYRKRVEYLYDVCSKNGLKPDRQNKNPSRLSRMPGVIRNGHKQFLIDTNIGKTNWAEWRDWIEGINDNLPDPEPLSSVWNNLPALSAPLIEGVLRQGHKMLLAGPSKAGKSFALIGMAISIAEGKKWLGFQCAQGRVLYVNLELDRASCLHRFKDVYDALSWRPEHIDSIDIWNLRGNSIPMDKLAPKLIRRAAKKNYLAIIIDPIYKVLTGDENSADQMAAFCNQFDKVCHELGAAVIYCHHHSKGYQGSKRSMDRASGSGVFARDPDALLDMVQLAVDDESSKTAWRIEGTLREFVKFDPVNVWFDYPVHKVDDKDELKSIQAVGEEDPKRKGSEAAKKANEQKRISKNFALYLAYEKLSTHGPVTTSRLFKELCKDSSLQLGSKRTLLNWIDACPSLERDDDGIVWKVVDDDS